MLKFLFDRVSPPEAPSWDHDSVQAEAAAPRRLHEMVGAQGYCSDYYKEWELRQELWNWLRGLGTPVPPGAFKDMLA